MRASYYDGKDASHLPPGPYQLTNSETYPYDAYAASPVHRFYQMWQQLDCDADAVESVATVGAVARICSPGSRSRRRRLQWRGAAGRFQRQIDRRRLDLDGLLQRAAGRRAVSQVPRRHLHDERQLPSGRQRRHRRQSRHARHRRCGLVQRRQWQSLRYRPTIRSIRPIPARRLPRFTSALSEIENPNPQPGTNNFYTQDGYGGGSGSPTATAPNANYGGGSYVNCADLSQPGVAAVVSYLQALPREVKTRTAQTGHYYLLNNYNPGYFGDGTNAYTDTNANNYVFTIPPSSLRNIGDALNDKHISWAYYGDQFERISDGQVPARIQQRAGRVLQHLQLGTVFHVDHDEQHGPRGAHLKDTSDLYAASSRHTCRRCPTSSRAARRRPSGLVEAQSCLRASSKRSSRGAGQPQIVGRDRHLRHLR